MNVPPHLSIEELVTLSRIKEYAHLQERIKAVILGLEGETAEEIADHLLRSRNWAQWWIYRFRDYGIEGLFDKPRSGTPPKLTPAQIPNFIARILSGPKTEDHVTVFMGKDFQRILKEEFDTELCLSSCYELLHRVGFSCLIPRPKHEKNDPKKMKEWLEEAPRFVRRIQKKIPKRSFKSGSLMKCGLGCKDF